jgi:hypothetical protein
MNLFFLVVLTGHESSTMHKHARLADDVAPTMYVENTHIVAQTSDHLRNGESGAIFPTHSSDATVKVEEQRKGLLLITASLLIVVLAPAQHMRLLNLASSHYLYLVVL